MTYEAAGVSINAGNALVQKIKAAVRSTRRPGAEAEIGGFGGTFDMKAAGCGDALLVAGIDGVGTKLKIACALKRHHSVGRNSKPRDLFFFLTTFIGIDLVAMNVNDLLAQGAAPLFFLDYYSTSKLDVEEAAEFIGGVAEGCKLARCALIGGETAEMPGMYAPGDYDAAGCAVGAVSKARLLPNLKSMIAGDVLIGLGSSGVHSNGYSLIRRIVEKKNLHWDEPAPWNPSASVGEEFLTPTRIYVKPLLKIADKGLVKGMSHITGGGITENVPRMLPEHLAAEIDVSLWSLPPVFKWLKRAGNVASAEFGRTWNTGLGFVIVVSEENHEEVVEGLKADGENAFVIGKLVSRGSSEGCILKNLQWWG